MPNRWVNLRVGKVGYHLPLTAIQGTFPGKGALGEGTTVIGIINTIPAEVVLTGRSMQGDTGMAVGLEGAATVGTGNTASLNGLMAAGGSPAWKLSRQINV